MLPCCCRGHVPIRVNCDIFSPLTWCSSIKLLLSPFLIQMFHMWNTILCLMSLNSDRQSHIEPHMHNKLFIMSCDDATIIEFAHYFTGSNGYNALPQVRAFHQRNFSIGPRHVVLLKSECIKNVIEFHWLCIFLLQAHQFSRRIQSLNDFQSIGQMMSLID